MCLETQRNRDLQVYKQQPKSILFAIHDDQHLRSNYRGTRFCLMSCHCMPCCKQGEGLEENYWQSGSVCLHGGAQIPASLVFFFCLSVLPCLWGQSSWTERNYMQPCNESSRLIVQLSRIPLVAVCALHTADPLIKEVCKFLLSNYKSRLKSKHCSIIKCV